MKRIRHILSLLLLIVGTVAAPARAAVIINTPNPSDYGATVMPSDYSLDTLNVGDERQGYVNDCYEVAVQMAITAKYPTYLQRIYQVQADGGVNVSFKKSDGWITYNVAPDINPWWGNPFTSYDGSNGNAAGQIMLKAYAAWRTPAGTMAGLNWGFPSESIGAYGFTAANLQLNIAAIIQAYQHGAIVILGTGPTVRNGLVVDHDYYMTGYDLANMTITARSPWGDGYAGYEENPQFTQSDLVNSILYATAGLPGGVIPVPEAAMVGFAVFGAGALLRRWRRAA